MQSTERQPAESRHALGKEESRKDRKKGRGKKNGIMHNGKRLMQYIPWFCLCLGIDGFAVLLLWIADVKALQAMAATIVLATALMLAAICAVVLFLEQGRANAFWDFLDTPDEYHEKFLQKQLSVSQAEEIHGLALVLREKQDALSALQTRLEEYEEYVETWAHETKMPLSLLALLLDNRREELPEQVGFKLDYIQSRLQESIDQMLFYARIKGMRKDYLFEHISVDSVIQEVLEDYRPLLEEKGFRTVLPETDIPVYTDRRSFRFLLQQVVSNAVKYSAEQPVLHFAVIPGERTCVLSVRDNGTGVKSCDLPFLFEKGFTGDCGENRKKATGMGLYLASEIGKDLKLALEADSQLGEGFEMRIVFPVVRSG